MLRSVITGTGSYIPDVIQLNEDFINDTFFEENGISHINSPNVIIEKFRKITGIEERRYVSADMNASDMAIAAAKNALEDSLTDPESLDQLIVAHNFGDVRYGTNQTQNVPSLASRVKHALGIRNPQCVAYDLLFGCPGWVQSLIQSHAYFKAGMASKVLLVGTETLSRVIDPHDRDRMIFADGAGACVMEHIPGNENGSGILGVSAQTHSLEQSNYINMGESFSREARNQTLYLKMKGRKVYEYAIKYVPLAMKDCIDKCGINILDIKKIFLHQANEKMDEEILRRLYSLYDISEAPEGVMPMSIQWLGNSSVATIPTLYDMVRKGKLPGHSISAGEIVLFASVGAGMNINAICYRV